MGIVKRGLVASGLVLLLAACGSQGPPANEQERACRLSPSDFASYVANGVVMSRDPHFLDGLRAVCPEKLDKALEVP